MGMKIVKGEGAVLEVNVGIPFRWGLSGVVILCCEGWRRGSSQITLGFLLVLNILGVNGRLLRTGMTR